MLKPESAAAKAARRIIADARRGPAMATAVEAHVAGLGTAQLRNVVIQLFTALADSYVAQHKTKGLDR